MAPKKQKGQKMDLSSFLADAATGNWADEMDDIPVAPIAKDPDALRRGDPGYFDSLPNRESRYPPREEIPMPTRPPFNAYVGNLAFDAVEEDLEMFFSGFETTSIKVIRDHEGKPKGFGYVQFATLDGLKEALSRSGENFQGRNVRISVAEPPKESGRGGFGDEPSAADTATQWRRAGPLPTRQQSGGNRYESSGGSGFGSAATPGADVDWSAARGTKFVARTPGGEGPGGQFGGGGFNRGPPREFGNREPRESMGLNALAETPTDWRSSRPARPQAPPSEARESFRGAPRGGFADREVGLSGDAATEESWSRGSKFKASEAPFQRAGAGSRRESAVRSEVEEKADWRSGKKSTEATPSGSADPSPQPARKQLSLLPRTNPASPTAEEASGSAKSSPFGAARAVDTAAREQEAMERAQKREEERKAQIEAAKQQRIAAAKERDAQKEAEGESKMAINTEPKRVHPSRQQQNGINLAPVVNDRPTNTNQKRESFKRDGPPAPGGAWRRASGDQQQQQHPSRSANPRQQPAQPEVDEDGFVVATGSAGRKAAAREQKAAQDQRDAASASKPKFSFAAAAGVDDFIEDAQDEDVAGAGTAAAQEEAGVQQATAGVNAVQI